MMWKNYTIFIHIDHVSQQSSKMKYDTLYNISQLTAIIYYIAFGACLNLSTVDIPTGKLGKLYRSLVEFISYDRRREILGKFRVNELSCSNF